MDYLLETQYQEYLTQVYLEEVNLEMIITEAFALESGYSENQIRVLQEGVIDKLKAGFNKIIGVFKSLMNKVSEATTYLVGGNAVWLEEYKDVILKNPLKEPEWEMNTYENFKKYMKNIQSMDIMVPNFNFNQLKPKLVSDEEFLKEISKANGMLPYKEGTVDEYFAALKEHFIGKTEKKVVNILELYNYCDNYLDATKVFKEYKKEMAKAEQEMTNEINALEVDLERQGKGEKSEEKIDSIKNTPDTNTEVKATSTQTTTTNNTTAENSSFIYKPIYSNLLERYIYVSEAPSPSGKGGTMSEKEAIKQGAKTAARYDAGETGARGIDTDSVTDKKEAIEMIQRYVRIAVKASAVGATVCEKMYKDYIYILRWHVKSYVKDANFGDKNKIKPAENGTTTTKTTKTEVKK